MFALADLKVGYGPLEVVHGVDLDVADRQLVALLGGNGAGKSTTLHTIGGILRPRSGTITFEGERIERLPSHVIYRRGIAYVPQGRELFADMTVRENLELGVPRHARREALGRIEVGLALFPRLRERLTQLAGTLSGGERAMLAIGRALASRPKLLLLDEPTAGLAPLMVALVARALAELKQAGQTILLVEQNVKMALDIADTVYVMRGGTIAVHGAAADLARDADLFRTLIE